MIKEKIFNYLSLILALITIVSAFYSYFTGSGLLISSLLLILTLIISSISRYLNEKKIKFDKKEIDELLKR